MELVNIFLPLEDNEGTPFPREAFARVRDELTERFGGVTIFMRAPADGFWKEGEKKTTADSLAIFEVVLESLDEAWWAGYRAELEQRFRQKRVLIHATTMRLV